ncbi:MAG: TIGR02147 family protein [Fibrobacter sp.]|uniref:TIGR02147 family protein n=1 Tax=unclassified Fibrobacter TaxID=2634177 RepID=UPI000BE361DE|nr:MULTISPECIES: TIGR02147 family protein [unclassified Fibrobacter]MBR1746384.1 TIGR02147 family protein [Fibrobacter sp.]MBR2307301.1 TIGR02147 family protein [Fibrobacter sp.]MBR4006207.1 TIGR02147 family protein [Fibrobacter sp.]
MSIALEHLFDYDDFRKFMQDYFEEQKKMRSVFSHRFFAAKAGFSSSSYCLNVIRGRFNLTPKSIEKISKAMDFEPLQKEYFEALVQYNQAQQVDERDQAWKQILQIRKQIEFTHITTREQAYFSKWYYPVIRELAADSQWHGDYRVLARSLTPQITTEEARDAVKNLLEWGLLRKLDDGRYVQTSQMLDAAEIPPIALRQIRREYIQHAIGAVESMPKDERFAAFTTLAMSESSYNYAVEVLEEARKKIIARASNDTNVERVYEMMLVAFPMSKKVGKEAEG